MWIHFSGDVEKNLNTTPSEIPNSSQIVHFCVQIISVCVPKLKKYCRGFHASIVASATVDIQKLWIYTLHIYISCSPRTNKAINQRYNMWYTLQDSNLMILELISLPPLKNLNISNNDVIKWNNGNIKYVTKWRNDYSSIKCTFLPIWPNAGYI